MKTTQVAAMGAMAMGLCATGVSHAQTAGETTTTTVGVSESMQVVDGWSVKKTLMGKAIYDDAGHKIGRVDDLIISPDRSVSYVIVGAGGFVGLGRHDVAFAVAQVEDQSGKLVIAGVTRESIKAMPAFDYAYDSAQRDRFIAAADLDIANGKARVTDLERKTDALSEDAKVAAGRQLTALRVEVKVADAKLTEMKHASAARWKEFEAGVSAATERLRKAVDVATS